MKNYPHSQETLTYYKKSNLPKNSLFKDFSVLLYSVQTDVHARAMETVLNNDEINVARSTEWECFHWDKTQQNLK
jgi:hypothetical protein